MKKILKKRTIVRTIEEEVETFIYETEDGIVFDDEGEALIHEKELEFKEYFKNKYQLKEINPFELGLNYGNYEYCHLIFIKKLSDENIDEIIRFYDIKDHPDDINRLSTGWSFVALINDANLWIFDQTDRKFIFQRFDEALEIKKNELYAFNEILKMSEMTKMIKK